MCVICASAKDTRQPTEAEIRAMFKANPDGAGYMTITRGKKVRISKGFMSVDELLRALKKERFGARDAVVYHFRISTQAGVNREMTQPFPYTSKLTDTKAIEVKSCPLGIAHNGIISLTTDKNQKEYSDTALFITNYFVKLVRGKKDLQDSAMTRVIETLTGSKLAVLDGSGNIHTYGQFTTDKDGLTFSNNYWRYSDIATTKKSYGASYVNHYLPSKYWLAEAVESGDYFSRGA